MNEEKLTPKLTCTALVPRRKTPKGRPHDEPCGATGHRYLIVGGLAVIDQVMCWKHKVIAEKEHPAWQFTSIATDR